MRKYLSFAGGKSLNPLRLQHPGRRVFFPHAIFFKCNNKQAPGANIRHHEAKGSAIYFRLPRTVLNIKPANKATVLNTMRQRNFPG